MTFPIIKTIDDVAPAVRGRPDFVIAERPGYTVIDYVYAGPDTFDDPVRRECRGLKFGPDGTILARPFHKFFNVGERPETHIDALDFDAPHEVMEKMDGSMVHPAVVNGELVLMTRMGHTDVAKMAERHLTPRIIERARFHLGIGYTPIFEFTAPDNRIVINYAESALTLLAVRVTRTGAYMPRLWVAGVAEQLGVRPVRIHTVPTGAAFLAATRAVTGIEGYVVRFADGHTVKAKGDDYVLKHKARDSVLQEKNVLALIMAGGLDDVLPLLEPAERERIEQYRDGVVSGYGRTVCAVADIVRAGAELDQKTFATAHLAAVTPAMRTLAFQVRGGADPRDAVAAYITKRAGSQTAVDGIRDMIGTTFAANDNNPASEVAA